MGIPQTFHVYHPLKLSRMRSSFLPPTQTPLKDKNMKGFNAMSRYYWEGGEGNRVSRIFPENVNFENLENFKNFGVRNFLKFLGFRAFSRKFSQISKISRHGFCAFEIFETFEIFGKNSQNFLGEFSKISKASERLRAFFPKISKISNMSKISNGLSVTVSSENFEISLIFSRVFGENSREIPRTFRNFRVFQNFQNSSVAVFANP